MTRDQKLAFHLEMVIWEDLPEGARMNARQIEDLMAKADDQKRRAYQRGLVRSPLLSPDEQDQSDPLTTRSPSPTRGNP